MTRYAARSLVDRCTVEWPSGPTLLIAKPPVSRRTGLV